MCNQKDFSSEVYKTSVQLGIFQGREVFWNKGTFYLQVLQKWIIIAIPQSSLLFFFCASNFLFFQSLYLLNPYFLYFLYCTILIYFPFLNPSHCFLMNLILHNRFSIRRLLQQLQPLLSAIQEWAVQSPRTELLYQVTDALNHYLSRSSRSQMFFKVRVLKSFANFT